MSLELDSVLDHIFEQTRRTIPFTVADVALIEEGQIHMAGTWGYGEVPKETDAFSRNDKNRTFNVFPIWETVCETKSANQMY